jgi:hypothetical protein
MGEYELMMAIVDSRGVGDPLLARRLLPPAARNYRCDDARLAW